MSESTDLATGEETGRELALPSSGNVIQSILAAAKDPDVDADKVKTMYDLAVGMMDRERKAEFNRAKIAAIREMPAIYKRGKSDKHRYAKFEDLHRAAMPVLARNGLTIDFRVGSSPKGVSVTPILRHENGWVEEGDSMEGPPDQGPGRTPIQAIGSSTSYLKRHSFKAMLNIIEDGEDDDGNYGFREDDQKNDRQERLVLDAEAAAFAGEYAEWYGKLTTKDKAWLVRAGVHARCSGAPSLPKPTEDRPVTVADRDETEDAEIEEIEPLNEDPPKAETPAAEPDPTTPEGWTTLYEKRCEEAESLDRLADIQSAGRNAIKKLETAHPKLHKRAIDAGSEAYARLSGTGGTGGDDLFGGEPAK